MEALEEDRSIVTWPWSHAVLVRPEGSTEVLFLSNISLVASQSSGKKCARLRFRLGEWLLKTSSALIIGTLSSAFEPGPMKYTQANELIQMTTIAWEIKRLHRKWRDSCIDSTTVVLQTILPTGAASRALAILNVRQSYGFLCLRSSRLFCFNLESRRRPYFLGQCVFLRLTRLYSSARRVSSGSGVRLVIHGIMMGHWVRVLTRSGLVNQQDRE